MVITQPLSALSLAPFLTRRVNVFNAAQEKIATGYLAGVTETALQLTQTSGGPPDQVFPLCVVGQVAQILDLPAGTAVS